MKLASRRAFILGMGAASTTGVVALASSQAKAQSSVEFGSLDIPNESSTRTEDVETVDLHVTANISIEGNVPVDHATLSLLCGEYPDGTSTIATKEITDIGESYSDSVELVGSVLDAYTLGIEDFTPSNGNTSTANLYVELQLQCFNESGDVLDTSSVSTEPRVSVTKEAVNVTSDLGGSGEVVLG